MYRFDNTWKCITNLEISLDRKINCKYAIKNRLRNFPIATYALRRLETWFLPGLKVLMQNFRPSTRFLPIGTVGDFQPPRSPL